MGLEDELKRRRSKVAPTSDGGGSSIYQEPPGSEAGTTSGSAAPSSASAATDPTWVPPPGAFGPVASPPLPPRPPSLGLGRRESTAAAAPTEAHLGPTHPVRLAK